MTSTLWYNGTDTSFAPGNLLTSGASYTWQVVAADPWDGITSGPLWEFTAGEFYLFLPLILR